MYRLGAVLALLLLLIVLVCSLPARVLGLVLAASDLQLAGFSGTLWQGRAARAVVVRAQGNLHLGRLQWQLHPLSLLTLSPEVSLNSQWGDQRLEATVQRQLGGAIELRGVDAHASAKLIKQFVPLALQGRISLQIAHLRLENEQPVAAQGRLVWQQGSWQAPQGMMPLGSYAVDFIQAQAMPLSGTVLTLSGPVQAGGTVALDGRDYAVDVTVSANAFDPQLEHALSLLAPRVNDGYRVQLNGQL